MNRTGVGDDELTAVRRLIALARAAGRVGNFDTARAVAEEACGRSRAGGYLVEEASCLNVLGSVAFERGQLDEAEAHYGRALATAGRCACAEVTAMACNNLGSIRHLRGDLAAARQLYHAALLGYEQLGAHRGQAESYHNLAITYRDAGDLTEAMRADRIALEHAVAAGEEGALALIHCSLAESAVRRGDTAMAEAQLSQAEFQARIGGDPLAAAEAHRVRAMHLASIGEPVRAMEALDLAVAHTDRIGSPLLRAECAALAARCLRQLDRKAEAEAQAAVAEQIFLALGTSDGGRVREAGPQ